MFGIKKASWIFFIGMFAGLQMMNTKNIYAQDSLAFGDKEWVTEALLGKIYILPAKTYLLPDFETLEAAGNLYTKKIDIPARNWNTTLPGIDSLNEAFGVVYTAQFIAKKPGNYTFRLLSDDGAKLYINKKLLIDNDGIHGPDSKLGNITLNNSKHSIRLEYFQGSKPQLALQLFATLEKESEAVFSSDNFTLITPAKKKTGPGLLMYGGAGLILLLLFYVWFRKKKKPVT